MLMSIEKEILTKINPNDIIDKVTAQSDLYKKKIITYQFIIMTELYIKIK